jgi:hypothetical protein
VNLDLPTIEMPEKLRAAAEALAERQAELRAAEAAVKAGEQAVGDAHRRDLEAVAEAREAGDRDPKPEHEQRAIDALAGLEREAEIMRARVRKLADEHARLGEELRPQWRLALERAWRKLDAQQRRRLAELSAGVQRTNELSRAWRFVDAAEHEGPNAIERTLRKAASPANAVQLDLADVSAAIEDASADRTIERVLGARRELHERTEATRAASEALAEQARQEREREIERARLRREARVN